MDIPPLVWATVQQQDPDNYSLMVIVHGPGGSQIPSVPVRVSTHGPRDAVRGDFPELPMQGNMGLVAFARGDLRSGIWIGTVEPGLNDANPYQPGWQGLHHKAKHSGAWSWSGPDGVEAYAMADGSTFLAGAAMPVPTRHVVNAGQRSSTAFTQAERVPKPPSALPIAITLASGVTITVSAAGAVSVTAAGAVALTADGTLALTSSGASATVTCGSAVLTLDQTGAFSLTGEGGAQVAGNTSGNITVVNAAGTKVALSGAECIINSGAGVAQPVRLADGSTSTILFAE